jgi:hypothetical protein
MEDRFIVVGVMLRVTGVATVDFMLLFILCG